MSFVEFIEICFPPKKGSMAIVRTFEQKPTHFTNKEGRCCSWFRNAAPLRKDELNKHCYCHNLRPAATRNAQRCVPNADPQRKGPKWVSSSADGVDAFSPGRKKHPKEPYVLKGHVTSSHGPFWSTDWHGLDAIFPRMLFSPQEICMWVMFSSWFCVRQNISRWFSLEAFFHPRKKHLGVSDSP